MGFFQNKSLLLGLAMGATVGWPALAQDAPPADAVSREYQAASHLFDSWKAPVPPRHLIGNIYYVGAIGVSAFLITTPDGHILIDTGFEATVPIIQRGVEQLGFKLRDIRFLLSSHAHSDHVGGHALMQKLTSARIVASAADAHTMETGGVDDFSPYPKSLMLYPPVKADRIIRDEEQVTLGGVTLTAHLTPGHTKGATTWTMDVTEAGHVYHVVFFSSISLVAGTRLLNNPVYPNIVEDYTATFEKLRALPCDIWFAPHGGQFAMAEKFEQLAHGPRQNPFIDPAGWKKTLADAETSFRRELEAEKTAAARKETANGR